MTAAGSCRTGSCGPAVWPEATCLSRWFDGGGGYAWDGGPWRILPPAKPPPRRSCPPRPPSAPPPICRTTSHDHPAAPAQIWYRTDPKVRYCRTGRPYPGTLSGMSTYGGAIHAGIVVVLAAQAAPQAAADLGWPGGSGRAPWPAGYSGRLPACAWRRGPHRIQRAADRAHPAGRRLPAPLAGRQGLGVGHAL